MKPPSRRETARRRVGPPPAKAPVTVAPAVPIEQITMRPAAVAAVLGTGLRYVEQKIQDGTLKSKKLGKMRLVYVSSVRELVAAST